MTLKLETLNIVSTAAGLLQTSDDGVRGILAAFYDAWPQQVPDTWVAVESGLQDAGATLETVGAFTAFLKTLTDDATVGENPHIVLDDAGMRGAFQRVPEVDASAQHAEESEAAKTEAAETEAEEGEAADAAEEAGVETAAAEAVAPERDYVAPGSRIFRVAGRYFLGPDHEVWQLADEFGIYFHDSVQNYDSQGNVLLDEDDEEEPEVSAAQGAAPDHDELCAQVVLHYAIPALSHLVSSSFDLAASRARDELIASLSSVLAHHLCGWEVPERADELVGALMWGVEREVQANPEPAAQFHAVFGPAGPVVAGQWLDYRFDEDAARIGDVLGALPRPKAEDEAETPAAPARDDADPDEDLLKLDPYDALLARVLEEVPRAAGMPPRELHDLVALALSE